MGGKGRKSPPFPSFDVTKLFLVRPASHIDQLFAKDRLHCLVNSLCRVAELLHFGVRRIVNFEPVFCYHFLEQAVAIFLLVRSGGVAEFFRSIHDDLLEVGGESLIEGLAHEHRRRSVDVIAHREVFLHFVELGAVYKGDRIFLRVDGLLEQCGVELAEVDGGRVGAEGLEEFKVSRNRLNADFDSLQIGGALYGGGGRPSAGSVH